MRIDGINNSYLNKTGPVEGKGQAVSPFGNDTVKFGSVASSPLISRAQVAGLFRKGPKWTFDWKGDVDLIGRGVAPSSDGSAYVARRSVISKLDRDNGSILWEKEFNGLSISSTPAVEGKDGSILVATGDHQLVSLDPKTGKENWAYYTRIPAEDPKIAPDGTIFTRKEQDVVALNQDGSEKFRFSIEDFAHNVRGFDKDGNAYITGDRGIFAIDNKGGEKWHIPGTDVHLFENDPEHIYTVQEKYNPKYFTDESDYTSELASRNPETGNQNWQRTFTRINVAGTAKNGLFLEDQKTIRCLDVKTGNDVWSSPAGEKKTIMALMEDGTVITRNESGIEALDPEKGALLWKMELEDVSHSNGFGTGKGTIIVNDKNHLYELENKTGKILFNQRIADGIESVVPSKDGKGVYVTQDKTKNISYIELTPDVQNSPAHTENDEPGKEIKVENRTVNIGGVVLPRMGNPKT